MHLTNTLAALLMVGCAAATTVSTVRLSRRIAGDDGLDQAAVGTLLWLSLAVGVPLLLACVDLLDRWSVLSGQVLVAVAIIRWVRPAPRPERVQRRASWSTILAVATGAGLVVLWGRVSLLRQPSQDPDTREYHIANLAGWLQRHNLWHLSYANPGYITATHPGNGEMLSLWLALPTHSDQLSYLEPLAFAVLAVVATAFLAREITGDGAAAGALAAMAVVSCPLIFSTQVHSIETDLPAAAGVVAGAAFLIRYRREPEWRWSLLAGLGLGLGIGSKYTALLPAAGVAIIGLAVLRQRRLFLGLLPGLALLAGPWLARNWVDTGNPVFPQQFSFAGVVVLGGASTSLAVLSTSMARHMLKGDWTVVRRWARFIAQDIRVAVLVPVVGILGGWRSRHAAALMVTAMTLWAGVAYLSTPYTGGGPIGYIPLVASNLRYVLPCLLLGSALLPAAIPTRPATVAAAVLVGYDVWWDNAHHLNRTDVIPGAKLVAVAAAAGLTIAAGMVMFRRLDTAAPRLSERRHRLLVSGLALVLALGVVDETLRVLSPVAITPAEAALDRVAGPHQPIIVVGVADVRSLLGPQLRRPLLGVGAGGRGDVEPFSTPGDVVAESEPSFVLPPSGDVPPRDRQLAAALDRRIAEANASLLATAAGEDASTPPGWAPPASQWCAVGPPSGGIVVYARRSTDPSACAAAAMGTASGAPSVPQG